MSLTPMTSMASFILITSTFMALSSTSWICLWMSMELNMFSFLPLMLYSKTNQEIEASVKYFINQAFASSLMILASYSVWQAYSISMLMMPLVLSFSILLKMGSFPGHFWFPSVMKSISWLSCLILSTWQKIAPVLILIHAVSPVRPLIITASLGNIFIGGWMGLNQVNLRSLLAYSSIAHMGWMLSLCAYKLVVYPTIYLILYILMTLPVFTIFYNTSTSTPKDTSSLSSLPPMMQLMAGLLLLSLAGLPPLSGFFPKLLILLFMLKLSPLMALLMVLMSFLSLYFYLVMTFSTFMVVTNNAMNLKQQWDYKMLTTMLATVMFTPFLILLYAMIMLN